MRWTAVLIGLMSLPVACSNEVKRAGQANGQCPETFYITSPYDYVGRWTGVEGMFLDVQPPTAPSDRYRLTMQYDLDHRQTVEAEFVCSELVFERDGTKLSLRRGNGHATGLKHLAGKKDCVFVTPGEGYCRD